MKKITMLALLSFAMAGQAQITLEASRDYAKMQDITYDATVQNKLYAATNGNHIVVSYDNGANWSVLYAHPTNEFLSELEMLPGNMALSFATRDAIHIFNIASNSITATFPIPQSGEPGAGPSWLNSYDLYDATGKNMVVDTGYSIGFSSYTKVFYTKDSGAHWFEIYHTVDHNNVFINDVAISPNNPDKIFMARGNGDSDIDGGLWISSNDGADWTETLEGVTLDAISFNPNDPNDMMIGSSIGFGIHPENLYRSLDNGTNWSIIPITWTDETLNCINKIVYNPANPNQITVLEENEIVRSNDGGATWQNVVYPVGISMEYYYGLNASYNPFDSSQIAITTDLYPHFFNNTTAEMTQIEAPFFNIVSTSVGRYAGNTHLYYSGQGGRLHKDITTGVTSAYEIENPDSFNPKRNYMIADPSIPGRVFTYASMGFFGGWVNMSTDYGATTTNILQAFADDIQELAIDPNNTNIIYVSMRSGESSNMVKIDLTDLGNIVTTDIATPDITGMGDGVVTGIVIDPTDSNVIYIAKRHKILKTSDAGENWTEIGTGLEGVTSADIIWDMAKNPLNPNQLTIGTNVGVFTSMDSGETWNVILPGTDAKRIKHSPLHDGVILVSVFNTEFVQASIEFTADNGQNWRSVTPEDLLYAQSYAMDYDFDGNTVRAYIATTDLGVIQYEISDVLSVRQNVAANNPVSIYPNPASDQINVFAKDSKVEQVSIYAISGQKVMESASENINVAALTEGVYMVRIQTGNGKTHAQKLVKK